MELSDDLAMNISVRVSCSASVQEQQAVEGADARRHAGKVVGPWCHA